MTVHSNDVSGRARVDVSEQMIRTTK